MIRKQTVVCVWKLTACKNIAIVLSSYSYMITIMWTNCSAIRKQKSELRIAQDRDKVSDSNTSDAVNTYPQRRLLEKHSSLSIAKMLIFKYVTVNNCHLSKYKSVEVWANDPHRLVYLSSRIPNRKQCWFEYWFKRILQWQSYFSLLFLFSP